MIKLVFSILAQAAGERGPLSLEKLSLQDDIVTYPTNDNTAHDFDAPELLALLSAQIPRTYESICRYIGRYSSRNRGERKKKAAALSPSLQVGGAIFGLLFVRPTPHQHL